MTTKIKDFYTFNYPSDELGAELDDRITFENLLAAIEAGRDIYEVMGAGDSIIRERLFGELADKLNVDYDVIYYMWLDSNSDPEIDAMVEKLKGVLKNGLQ